MTKKIVMLTSVAALAVCALAFASTNRIVGVLAGAEGKFPTLQLTSRGTDTATVRTDENTAFMKWATHKPWQGGERLTKASLVQGSCIEVEMRSESSVAKVVRVSDEPARSIFDPCRDRRELR